MRTGGARLSTSQWVGMIGARTINDRSKNMKIKINSAKDHLMWYANKIGEIIPVERVDDKYYWCREDAGFINIVHRVDASVVDKSQ